LGRPDDKFLPLMFAAAAARELDAAKVGLVSPYLAYMRQDRRFQPGEAVTSTYFARLLSSQIDWLVTVDPHLHRRESLAEIYSIPTQVMHAAPLISDWIRAEVKRPLLIGPDSESEQWVAAVACNAGAPHVVLWKMRRGDRDVEVSVPDVARWRDHTPVLVDDIVSTGRTMIETIGHLKREGMQPPVCIGVHGIFAVEAFSDLMAAGAGRVVTTNTIPHMTNSIDVTALLAHGVRAVAG
jgi:ribose-phosphate pyrophosphokinase